MVAVIVMAGSCSSNDKSASTASTTAAVVPTTAPATVPTTVASTDFYAPPNPLPAGRPGDIIRSEDLATPASFPTGGTLSRILYRSTNTQGDPIAVSGLLYRPGASAGVTGPRPIVAIAHPTSGLADACAPSVQIVPAGGGSARGDQLVSVLLPVVAAQLPQAVLVMTDYEGLGTPGDHPFVMGISEAHGVLDSIRAAQRFDGAGTSAKSPAVVWGHSQGGEAALVSADLAGTYAPDANVVGVAAGSPADPAHFGVALQAGPSKGYVLMAGAGLKAAYPSVDLSRLFTPAGLAGVDLAAHSCTETIAKYKDTDPATLFKGDATTLEPFKDLLMENSPAAQRSVVPIFLYHGEADPLIPVQTSKVILDQYCHLGSTVLRKTYPGGDHFTVVLLALTDIEHYLADRLAGSPAPSSC